MYKSLGTPEMLNFILFIFSDKKNKNLEKFGNWFLKINLCILLKTNIIWI